MPLRSPIRNDVDVKNAKPEEAPYKRRDAEGAGMYLLVKPDGGKYWRFKYRFAGREKLLALGVYPDTTLKAARTKRQEAREIMANGADPGAARQEKKRQQREKADNTFRAIALEWMEKRGTKWSDAHRKAVKNRLEKNLFSKLGPKAVSDVDSQLLLEVLREIEARGAHEVAAKARAVAGQVFRYAIATNRAKYDPTPALRGALEVVEKKHYARLAEGELPAFLEKLESYDGTTITKLAIRLLVLTFVRTGELRGATWPEIDFAKNEWRIPAERMKGRHEHIVPLSTQSVEALEELQTITGEGDYLFPNEHNSTRPMSENTILFALYRMGYRGRATGHGFRATASTILNAQNWKADAIERQLAHKETNKIRAAYHHTQYLPERTKMMQSWADFLDAKRKEADKVISIAPKRA